MKLTHDKVRALVSMIDDLSVPYAGGLAPHHDTARALADEWLAARTVRWRSSGALWTVSKRSVWYVAHDALTTKGSPAWKAADRIGTVARDTWHATEAEARAWLEAKAREAGYEVEGGG